MKFYIKYRLWDWILASAASFALVMHVYSGFLLEDRLSGNPIAVAVAVCILQAVFYIFARSRRMAVIGIVAGVVLLVIFLIYARSVRPFEDETANSLCITCVVTILTSLLVFLATRSRPGTVVLLIAGNFIIVGSYFLQFPIPVWGLFVFWFAVCMMLPYRNYMITLSQIGGGKIRIRRYVWQIFCGCVAAILIAVGVYAGIIRPLSPPTQELKLITKLEQMKALQIIGVSSIQKYLDPNISSSLKEDQVSYANHAERSEEEKQGKAGEPEEKGGDDRKDPEEQVEVKVIHYDLGPVNIPWLFIILCIIVAACVILKVYSRKNWRKQLRGLSNNSAVFYYYRFFLKAFKKAGFKKPVNHTLYEYAANMEHQMQVFDKGEAAFLKLTDIYVKSTYGCKTVTEGERALFEQFDCGFYRKLRKEIGWWRYIWKAIFI